MKKQDEIDWGLRNLLSTWVGNGEDKYLHDLSRVIRIYLASQGVVLKVEGELPNIHSSWREWDRIVISQSQQDILAAGYTKTEPLIGE